MKDRLIAYFFSLLRPQFDAAVAEAAARLAATIRAELAAHRAELAKQQRPERRFIGQ